MARSDSNLQEIELDYIIQNEIVADLHSPSHDWKKTDIGCIAEIIKI